MSYLVRALGLIWESTRGWTVAWAACLVIQGVLPAITIYLTKVIIDTANEAIGGGLSWENVEPVAIPAAIMGAALLIGQILSGLIGWIRTAQGELVQDHIKNLIHDKAASVDLEFYETPEYFDEMERANNQAEARSLSILQNLGNLLRNAITLISIAGLLIPYAWWLPLLLLVSTLPALGVVVRHNRKLHAWWHETTEKRRWVTYYDQVLTLRLFAAEVRIFKLNDFFRGAYSRLRKELRESRIRLMRNQNIANFGAGFLAFVVMAGTMTWMVWRAFRGEATLGSLALFYQSFNQGQSLMRTLLSGVGQLYADTLFLEHLFSFLSIESEIKRPDDPVPAPPRLEQGIEIRDGRFSYPGSERAAVKDLNIIIPGGKTAAIVGPNGAGKSTLIKLLCRFYDPQEGQVLFDGTDIREIAPEELWEMITVLFQYHVNYAGTVEESIAVGDMASGIDRERVRTAAEAGGATKFIEELPLGYDTILGKQFRGGEDLSGGQWQRLALARAFYRPAPILLLDEPTSFMDSWAESMWLDRFRDLIKGRTAVVVTHRFTTAMRADIIFVMDEGRVIESGSHEELLAMNGLYAGSWRAQMRAERELSSGTDS
ncbi:MAG: ABC transporter ATP-binding protein [Rhodothermales bacterium]|nr:ABC transporter ATP-binding protein [Rhodothermales bacterium]